jgi:GxxExxY protein
MDENSTAASVVNCALEIHKELGPGLLESVYEVLPAEPLRERGFSVERQKPIPIRFRGKRFDEGFRADLVVGNIVLVELKSLESLARVHRKQVLTYLRLSHLKLELLINFGGELLKGKDMQRSTRPLMFDWNWHNVASNGRSKQRRLVEYDSWRR